MSRSTTTVRPQSREQIIQEPIHVSLLTEMPCVAQPASYGTRTQDWNPSSSEEPLIAPTFCKCPHHDCSPVQAKSLLRACCMRMPQASQQSVLHATGTAATAALCHLQHWPQVLQCHQLVVWTMTPIIDDGIIQ